MNAELLSGLVDTTIAIVVFAGAWTVYEKIKSAAERVIGRLSRSNDSNKHHQHRSVWMDHYTLQCLDCGDVTLVYETPAHKTTVKSAATGAVSHGQQVTLPYMPQQQPQKKQKKQQKKQKKQRRVYIGKIARTFRNNTIIIIDSVRTGFAVGDILQTNDGQSVMVETLQINRVNVERCNRGDAVGVQISSALNEGTKLFMERK